MGISITTYLAWAVDVSNLIEEHEEAHTEVRYDEKTGEPYEVKVVDHVWRSIGEIELGEIYDLLDEWLWDHVDGPELRLFDLGLGEGPFLIGMPITESGMNDGPVLHEISLKEIDRMRDELNEALDWLEGRIGVSFSMPKLVHILEAS